MHLYEIIVTKRVFESRRVSYVKIAILSPDEWFSISTVLYYQFMQWYFFNALQWNHNGRDCVSNNQTHDFLLNRLFRCRSKKTWKLRVTGLCEGNSPVAGEFPAQMASNVEKFPFHWHTRVSYHYSDVIMSEMASQITGVSIVYLAVCSGADQRKHQSSASLVIVQGIHRWPVNYKGPVMRNIIPFDDVNMWAHIWKKLTPL